jgi:predicted negative regulator of RcsB-dependent stress response
MWSSTQLQDYGRNRAGWLANLSSNRQIDPILGYQAAMVLAPQEPSYRAELAQIYLAAQQPERALEALQDAEDAPGSPSLSIIRSKALVELNRAPEAAELTVSSENTQLQQALALAAGGRSQSISLNKALMSEEGITRLARIQAGGLALAQELNLNGMPRAALRTLEGLPNDSVLKFQLITQIRLAIPQATKDDLNSALNATTQGLVIDPSNLKLYRLRLEVLNRLGAKNDAAATANRIERLESGRF